MKTTGLKYKSFRLLGLAAAALMAATSLVACSDDKPTPPAAVDEEAGMMKISFLVAAPGSRLSRADEDKAYEDGEVLESTIDFVSEDYRIYFFGDDNKFIAEWLRVAEVHVVTGVDNWRYTFEGAVPKDLKEHSGDFQIMVLANWPAYPDYRGFDLTDKSIDDLVSAEWARFDEFKSFNLKEEGRLIPFYGLKSCSAQAFEADKTYDLGAVSLLRAVAKVEVNLTGLPDDVIIDGDPYIHGVNPQGYCAPKGLIGSGNNWDTDYVVALHTPYSNMNHENARWQRRTMHKIAENKWIAYLPEFNNKNAGDNFSSIKLPLKYLSNQSASDENEGSREFILNFATYDADGRPDNVNKRFDIRRNDLYRFYVKGDLHEIKFNLDVTPWQPGGRTEIEI